MKRLFALALGVAAIFMMAAMVSASNTKSPEASAVGPPASVSNPMAVNLVARNTAVVVADSSSRIDSVALEVATTAVDVVASQTMPFDSTRSTTEGQGMASTSAATTKPPPVMLAQTMNSRNMRPGGRLGAKRQVGATTEFVT